MLTLLIKQHASPSGGAPPPPIALDAGASSTLAELRARIARACGVPPALQRLTALAEDSRTAELSGDARPLASLGLAGCAGARELTLHRLTQCACAFCAAHPAPALCFRAAARAGWLAGPTAGLAAGRAQANLVLLPSALAPAFRAFCAANPQACPLLEEGAPGALDLPRTCASGCDVRTDVPRYQVWRGGAAAEALPSLEGAAAWAEGAPWCAFALGCSLSLEEALQRGGVEVRHGARRCNVPMYRTARPAVPSGPFSGPLVVSMRPMPLRDAVRAAAITAAFPRVHGAPVQVGCPEALGIASLARPDFGDAVPLAAGELPVFWACGVTASLAASRGAALCITHAPGHMLVLDVTNEELAGAACDWE